MDNTIRIFRPKGIIGICACVLAILLLVFTVASGVYVFLESKEIRFTVLVMICVIGLTIFELRWIISLFCRKIVIGLDAIHVRKNKSYRDIQQEVSVLYAEIKTMRIVVTKIPADGITLFYSRPIANICIELDNEELKMIIVDDYSKKQVIAIMDEIIQRAQAVGKLLESPNVEELIKQANEQYCGSKKKKK